MPYPADTRNERTRDLWSRKRRAGECVSCHNYAAPYARCESCRQKAARRQAKVRAQQSVFSSYDEMAKAERHMSKAGYVLVCVPGRGSVREHIAVAEVALGRPMPKGAVVHHVNEDKSDNRPANLVICQDHAYHAALHKRMRARAAGRDPWAKAA